MHSCGGGSGNSICETRELWVDRTWPPIATCVGGVVAETGAGWELAFGMMTRVGVTTAVSVAERARMVGVGGRVWYSLDDSAFPSAHRTK